MPVTERFDQSGYNLGIIVHDRAGADGTSTGASGIRILVRVPQHMAKLVRGNIATVRCIPVRHVTSGRTDAHAHTVMLSRGNPLYAEPKSTFSETARICTTTKSITPFALNTVFPSVPQIVHCRRGDTGIRHQSNADRNGCSSLGVSGIPTVNTFGNGKAHLLGWSNLSVGKIVHLGNERTSTALFLMDRHDPTVALRLRGDSEEIRACVVVAIVQFAPTASSQPHPGIRPLVVGPKSVDVTTAGDTHISTHPGRRQPFQAAARGSGC